MVIIWELKCVYFINLFEVLKSVYLFFDNDCGGGVLFCLGIDKNGVDDIFFFSFVKNGWGIDFLFCCEIEVILMCLNVLVGKVEKLLVIIFNFVLMLNFI